jgi:hypothetical protein
MAHHASKVNERVILNRALIRVLLYFEAYRRQAKRASRPSDTIRNQYDTMRVRMAEPKTAPRRKVQLQEDCGMPVGCRLTEAWDPK